MALLAHETITGCNELTASRTLGQLFTDESTGYTYRYVRFRDAVTYAAGQVCTYAVATSLGEVTNDISGGSSIGSIVAGICLRVMTQNYYGFVLVKGFYATVKTSGADDIAVGENLFVHGATDGTCDGASASTWSSGNFGVAMAADIDADNTVAALVSCAGA